MCRPNIHVGGRVVSYVASAELLACVWREVIKTNHGPERVSCRQAQTSERIEFTVDVGGIAGLWLISD